VFDGKQRRAGCWWTCSPSRDSRYTPYDRAASEAGRCLFVDGKANNPAFCARADCDRTWCSVRAASLLPAQRSPSTTAGPAAVRSKPQAHSHWPEAFEQLRASRDRRCRQRRWPMKSRQRLVSLLKLSPSIQSFKHSSPLGRGPDAVQYAVR